MKPAILCLALFLSFRSLTPAAVDSLSADELAHHLGVESWVSKAHLQGANYEVQVIRVKGGKEADVLLTGVLYATDREFTRLAIQASKTDKGMKISLQPEVGAKASIDGQAPISSQLKLTNPLPSILAPGDYVLGGDIPQKRVGENQPPLHIDDVKDGLLLRVTKK